MREIYIFHDPEADGSCFVAIFSGFMAEERAKRFADRLRTNTD